MGDYIEREISAIVQPANIGGVIRVSDLSARQRQLLRIGIPMPDPGDWKPITAISEAQARFLGSDHPLVALQPAATAKEEDRPLTGQELALLKKLADRYFKTGAGDAVT